MLALDLGGASKPGFVRVPIHLALPCKRPDLTFQGYIVNCAFLTPCLVPVLLTMQPTGEMGGVSEARLIGSQTFYLISDTPTRYDIDPAPH